MVNNRKSLGHQLVDRGCATGRPRDTRPVCRGFLSSLRALFCPELRGCNEIEGPTSLKDEGKVGSSKTAWPSIASQSLTAEMRQKQRQRERSIYIYIYIHIHRHTHIYIFRERQRKRQFVHNFGAPPPNQPSDGFPLDFLLKGPQTELQTLSQTTNKLSQNCEQTEL